MTRSQRLPACRRSRKSSTAVVAPSSVTSRDYHKMSRRTRPSAATSTCLSADHPTTSGNAARADPQSDGLTRSGRTTEVPRRTCRGVRRVVVTEEQRLRDNDDDEFSCSTRQKLGNSRCQTGNFVEQQSCVTKLPNFVACLTLAPPKQLHSMTLTWADMHNDGQSIVVSQCCFPS